MGGRLPWRLGHVMIKASELFLHLLEHTPEHSCGRVALLMEAKETTSKEVAPKDTRAG